MAATKTDTRTEIIEAIEAVFVRWSDGQTRGEMVTATSIELGYRPNKYDVGAALRAMKAAGRLKTRGKRWYRVRR